MADNVGMAAQLAGQSLRFGWYFALNRALDWRTDQLGKTPRYKPTPSGPVAARAAGRSGAAADEPMRWPCAMACIRRWMTTRPRRSAHLARVRQMFADLPEAYARRADKDATTAKAEAAAAGVPEYYAQDFHFQTGGYLTEGSARLYDVQVETLFMGAAGPDAAQRAGPHRRVHARARPAQGHAGRCGLRHGALPAPGAACLSRHDAEGARPVAALSGRGSAPARRPARRGADRGGGARRCRSAMPAPTS